MKNSFLSYYPSTSYHASSVAFLDDQRSALSRSDCFVGEANIINNVDGRVVLLLGDAVKNDTGKAFGGLFSILPSGLAFPFRHSSKPPPASILD